MMISELIRERRAKRHLRVRKKVSGTQERPRLTVRRSHLNLFVQVIDDMAEKTFLSASTLDADFRKGNKKNWGNLEGSKAFGVYLAGLLQKKNLKKIVFDRREFGYHGRLKALAETLREKGIEF